MSNKPSDSSRGGQGSGSINNSESIKPATIITVTRGTNGSVTFGTQSNGNGKQGK